MPRKFKSTKLAGQVLNPKALDAIGALKLCLVKTLYCLPLTCAPMTLGCKAITKWGCLQRSICPAVSIEWNFDPNIYADQLAELRADLRSALASLDTQEKEHASAFKEGSRLYVDELEAGLKDALDEVEVMKRKRR